MTPPEIGKPISIGSMGPVGPIASSATATSGAIHVGGLTMGQRRMKPVEVALYGVLSLGGLYVVGKLLGGKS